MTKRLLAVALVGVCGALASCGFPRPPPNHHHDPTTTTAEVTCQALGCTDPPKGAT